MLPFLRAWKVGVNWRLKRVEFYHDKGAHCTLEPGLSQTLGEPKLFNNYKGLFERLQDQTQGPQLAPSRSGDGRLNETDEGLFQRTKKTLDATSDGPQVVRDSDCELSHAR